MPGLVQSTSVHTCICPGDVLTYVCSSMGALTVWKGSAFQCEQGGSSHEIHLLHRKFVNGTSGVCNNGAIVAYSIGVIDNRYTSQLNVTVSPEMDNRTVECAYDDGITETIVGVRTVILTPGILVRVIVQCSITNTNVMHMCS